ncbi:stimulator of interferon genes protein-like [Teleopsis dalmanni]|uniref:stimulator of interferon genes protein-like n=1 Tax=Teleopsis dalmanni TaxID=139649 RepID=UPI0018CDD10E|nr:stimulator of interferon genes protein-like [Teleopsis dalmanni]
MVIVRIEDMISNSCIFLTSLIVAALINLCWKMGYEWLYYKHHYHPPNIVKQIFLRVFEINIGIFLILVIDVILLVYFWSKLNLLELLFDVPLCLVAMASGLLRSEFDQVSFIRKSHSLDYAGGMASNYYFGYLKHVLAASVTDVLEGICERIKLYSAQHSVSFVSDKLVILIPNTMYLNPKIDDSKLLEKTNALEPVIKNRAGVQRRFYNDVYRIKKPINNKYYYIVLEGATPLQSFYDAMQEERNISRTSLKRMQREILLKFYTYLKKLLLSRPDTENEAELILYNAYKEDGSKVDVGEVIISYFHEKLKKET